MYVALSILLVMLFLKYYYSKDNFKDCTMFTWGMVTDCECDSSLADLVVSYKVHNTTYTVESIVTNPKRSYKKWEKVGVHYNPEEPGRGYIHTGSLSNRRLMITSYALMTVSVIVAILALRGVFI